MQITGFPCIVNLSHCNKPPRRLDCLASSVCEGLAAFTDTVFFLSLGPSPNILMNHKTFRKLALLPFSGKESS
jgi:hypothetical protein